MAAPRTKSIAVHVEAAKRLLGDLERHAAIALHTLDQESGDAFLSAVDERDSILSQLDGVVQALTDARAASGEPVAATDSEAKALFAEVAQAAARAVEAHNHLASQTRRERDRLAAALQLTSKPDSVAHQYAMTSNNPQLRSLSVTG